MYGGGFERQCWDYENLRSGDGAREGIATEGILIDAVSSEFNYAVAIPIVIVFFPLVKLVNYVLSISFHFWGNRT